MRPATRQSVFGLVVAVAIGLPLSWTWSAPLASPALPPPGTPLAIDLFRTIARQQNPVVVSIMTTARVADRSPAEELLEWLLRDGDRAGARIERGLGSGFIISRSGEILTNDHVVAGADAIDVALFGEDSRTYRAVVIGRDPISDVALIRLEQPPPALPAATFGDSDAIAPGDWVMAIGNPFELGHTVTVGVVSHQGRPFQIEEGRWQDMIQTDASIYPGNSGGPLLNVRGEVIGINAVMLDESGGNLGIGFAIPINSVKALLTQLRAGRVVRGNIGVHVRGGIVTDSDAKALGLPDPGGAIVAAVEHDSPAERAGLRAGDVISHVDGTPLADAEDFVRRVSAATPGARLDVTIQRDGRSSSKPVMVEELCVEDGQPPSAPPAPPGDIGARFIDLSPSIAQQLELPSGVAGAVVYEVSRDSAADRAGLVPGDVVQRINRHPVRTAAEAAGALAGVEAGSSVFVLVWRGRDEVLLQIRDE
jgi:serine protease Do